MASVTPSIRHFSACLRCVRPVSSANGTSRRLLSSSATAREELQAQTSTPPPPPPSEPPTGAAKNSASKNVPEYMQTWGTLDPQMVENKKQERRLLRREHVQPVGSRRRRAALRRSAIQKTTEVPFEQLPYQCFQEARKFLLEDRQEKLKEIETQQLRIKNLTEQDPAISGGLQAKEARLRSMRKHLNELIILADINDPVVKRKFEDGQGDMNKPIYRYLADQKWRKYKRLVLEQRVTQLAVIPDFLPTLDIVADIDLGFGRKAVAPGEFVDSAISEKMPRLNVQTFTPGEKLVTVLVVDGDVPVPDTDSFTYRCHFIASNITISPTQTSIPLQRIAQEDQKTEDPAAKKITLPWIAPWAHKGAPYHRLAIFVLEQNEAKPLDVSRLSKTTRDKFNLRSFVDIHKLKPITATLFRTKWDESMARVMERAGLQDQINVEFKRKRVEPLPHKRRIERMRTLSPQIPFVPSCPQAALALVIIQSKPPTTSVRDYILELRAQVRHGQNPTYAQDSGHYLDLVAYWQEQYRRARNECDELRSINVKLERSNHSLSSRASETISDGDTTVRTSKRKPPTGSSSRAQKRSRPTQQRSTRDALSEAQDVIESDADFLDGLGEEGTTLTEALFTTHNLCRAAKPDTENLCLNLVRISSVLGKVVRLVAHNHEHLSRHGRRTPGAASLDQDKTDFSTALSICARAFMSILVGTGKLADCHGDKRLPSVVVCELVKMFKTALNTIEVSAQQTSQMATSHTIQPKVGKGKAPDSSVKESTPARAVAHLLISFLGFLEKTDPIHQKIFDGFVFVLFEQIGKRLYYCTFGRPRSTTVEGNILNIPESHDAAGIAKRDTEALAIRLEVKALVLILERAMGLAPNHMNPQTTRGTKTPNRLGRTLSVRNLPATSRARLSPIAKDRLQRTLVTCMYGTKADDEFLDVLTKPVPAMRLGQQQNVAKVDDKDVEDWYKQEVWRLVGWDILAKEGGLGVQV
ncbi:mitochondrial 54S ribosomal protein YmL35 [Neocucurbitaria cava]|uniref:Large ribosomal subunit protein mL38 n=1 Tax=Neocucurbitaria cava TaxID=798079 RepID=A0A9W8YF59_9PLEO|nr:mitochondrial 54S ribosomal protein YmL35 [Neocucurbitaria cava]